MKRSIVKITSYFAGKIVLEDEIDRTGVKALLSKVDQLLLCPGVTETNLQSQPEVLHDQWYREIRFQGSNNATAL